MWHALLRPSEYAPLLPGTTQKKRTSTFRVGGWCLLALLVFSPLIYQTYVHMYCPPDPATRDATRREWDSEIAQHDSIQRDWVRKSQEQAKKEGDWKRATEQYEKEVQQRMYEERMRQEQARREWAHETERHVREFEEMRARERAEWTRERQRWLREIKERDQREEEERQRLNMYWGHVEAHTCTSYMTRKYTAQLMNLPRAWKNRVSACKGTPLEIHGISYLPKTCEDRVSDSLE